MELNLQNARIAVIGLGYVGLPLAVEFGKKYPTIGFDIDDQRIKALNAGLDKTLEVEAEEINRATLLSFTSQLEQLHAANLYIITVPTPIDVTKHPDLTRLIEASQFVGSLISAGDIVIYESTVYPGATEDDCIPVIEQASGLRFNHEFFAGYSPERVNPGDKKNKLTNIRKITSGSTPEVTEYIDQLYQSIIEAGTYRAPSIRVAEAAKVIENTQRDLNIALINEFALIFNRIGIDTEEVLKAAGTKWNFLPFMPGLVGGHCIGVDPYYLAHKAESLGYHPDVILAGRRINDGMGAYVVTELIKAMLKKRIHVEGARILIMGFTFKENCPDVRNTRVVDIVKELQAYHVQTDVYDPWVPDTHTIQKSDARFVSEPDEGRYDAIVLAVAHDQFKAMGVNAIRGFGKQPHILYDLKYLFSKGETDIRL